MIASSRRTGNNETVLPAFRSVTDLQAFRALLSQNAAPKTLNRPISSLSSFYKYLAAAAAEMRLPITVPNPAHAQFISRESPTRARRRGHCPRHGSGCDNGVLAGVRSAGPGQALLGQYRADSRVVLSDLIV